MGLMWSFVWQGNIWEVWAKVIFLHLSVILFTGGGSASVHAGIADPLPPGAPPPLGPDTPPGADTRPCTVRAGRYGQQAGGTHPTGMHTCYCVFWLHLAQIQNWCLQSCCEKSVVKYDTLWCSWFCFFALIGYWLRQRMLVYKWMTQGSD